MPQGKGTYGSKVGRPPKIKKLTPTGKPSLKYLREQAKKKK